MSNIKITIPRTPKETSKFLSFILMGCLFLVLASGCSKDNEIDESDNQENNSGVISFSGYDWLVRTTGDSKVGPGPNYFSNSKQNVWVDSQGDLHLRIMERHGIWYCSEVTLLESLGYGHYLFQIESRVDLIDKNIIAAMFLYRDDTKEIDIEYSRWGNENSSNAQFVVQPSTTTGNKERFNIQMDQKSITNIIDWQEDAITFSVYKGAIEQPDDSKLIKKWIYTGADNPSSADDLAVKINFWLMSGTPPSDQKDAELIISKFKYY